MASFLDDDFVIFGEKGPAVIPPGCRLGQRRQDIEVSQRPSRLLNPSCRVGDLAANVVKEFRLQFGDAFLRARDLALIFFEFGRGEPLGTDKGLLAFVIGGGRDGDWPCSLQ